MPLYYSENLNPRVAVAVARYLDSPVEFVRASPRRPDLEDAREAYERALMLARQKPERRFLKRRLDELPA